MALTSPGHHAGAMSTTPSGEQPAPPADAGPRVSTQEMRDLARLRRTVGPQRRVAGVAGGIARHFDIDPLLVRVIFVVTSFFGGAGVLAYLGCWLLVPDETGESVIRTQDRTRSVALLVLGGLVGLTLVGNSFGGTDVWPLVVIGGVVGLVLYLTQRTEQRPYRPGTYGAPTPTDPTTPLPETEWAGYPGHPGHRADQQPAPPPPPPVPQPDPRKRGPRLFWPVVLLIALAWGVLGLVDVSGTPIPFAAYPALGIAVVGAGLLLGSTWGRAGGLIAVGLLLLPVLTIASTVARVDDRPTVVTPMPGDTIPPRYSYNLGDHTVDLTQVDPDELGRPLLVESGAGRLRVIVPDEIDVTATGRVGLGSVEVFGSRSDDPGAVVGNSVSGPSDTELDLSVQLGAGDVEIIREGAQ